jgi:hypothetical protein
MGRSDDDDTNPYIGFKGRWENRQFVFESKEERDRWQIVQYGHVRDGFLQPDEGRHRDNEPRLRIDKPFWKDADEEARYERAVHFAPPEKHGSMDFYAYLAEIAKIATGIKPTKPIVKPMPHAPLPPEEE